MSDTGYNWDAAWTAWKGSGGGDWTADALADNATETGNTAVSLDGKAAMETSIAAAEDNTGAIDGVCTVFVLGDIDGTNFEETDKGNPFRFAFTPVQNDTVYIRLRLLGSDFSKIKLALFNESGQEIAITAKYRFATIPVAS